MDLNDIRSAVTLAGLLLFLCLVGWTWARGRRAAFDAAAALPLIGERDPNAGERHE
jgi:cbb3-type cytochrome oxidase subunit 3